MREDALDPFIEIALSVTNSGTTAACFIQLQNLTLKDAADATLTGPGTTFLQGSVLAIDPVFWVDTCLFPGESGWFFHIEPPVGGSSLFSSIVAIEFQYGAREFPSSQPGASVIPDGYSVSTDSFTTVCFTNRGTGPAAIPDANNNFSMFVMLDEAGDPLFWDFVTGTVRPKGLLQPGESGAATTQFPSFFGGTAHRMRAFIDFGVPREPPDANVPLSLIHI